MTRNILFLGPEVVGVVAGFVVLLLFALSLAWHLRPIVKPGESGHRDEQEEGGETVRPDGYIDTFSGIISEAGGGLPPVVKLSLLVILWWFIYLVVNLVPGKLYPIELIDRIK